MLLIWAERAHTGTSNAHQSSGFPGLTALAAGHDEGRSQTTACWCCTCVSFSKWIPGLVPLRSAYLALTAGRNMQGNMQRRWVMSFESFMRIC
eukprot:2271507-Rhodomonas_salina.2